MPPRISMDKEGYSPLTDVTELRLMLQGRGNDMRSGEVYAGSPQIRWPPL